MDFSLNEEQRHWQQEARKFADDELRPQSLKRDQIEGGFEPWDWDIIEKGSKLGFRTLAVPKEWGGPGADFVTQAIVMAELARGDSAMSKAFSQNWKWSHLIAGSCTRGAEGAVPEAVPRRPQATSWAAASPSRTRAPTTACRREDAPKAGFRLRAERDGDEWVLNGEKCFIANGSVGSLFFVDARTNPDVNVKQGGTLFMVPKTTPGFRVGKVFNKRGWRFYQNAELIFENARVPHANVVGEVNGGTKASAGDTTGGDIFGDLELAANALGVCDDAVDMAMRFARDTQARRQARDRPPARPVEVERDARAHRSAALVRDARRVGARPGRARRRERGTRDEPLDRHHPARDPAQHGCPRRRGLHDERARGQAACATRWSGRILPATPCSA